MDELGWWSKMEKIVSVYKIIFKPALYQGVLIYDSVESDYIKPLVSCHTERLLSD